MSTRQTPLDVLAGGGEMGALMRTIDWSKTAVGPVETWPQSLRTALSILLETGFPMYIAWGPDFTQFYNDGYRPILGSTKHPRAMGASTRETFREIWDIIGPMFEGVTQGTPTTLVDFMLPLDRHGFAEECYFVFSYSPIRQEDGNVGGVLVTVHETTQRVLGERRLKTSQALGARTRHARSVTEACELSAGVLSENQADLPYALIYLLSPDGAHAMLEGTTGLTPGTPAAPHVVPLDDSGGWPFADIIRSRQPWVGEGTMILPIVQAGAVEPSGLLVAGISPRLMLDVAYRDFLVMTASQIGTAIAGARALEEAKARADALAEIDRAKTAFFNNVSHEFRTPLTLLLGPTEEALLSSDPVLRGEDLATVHRNAQRLLKLVNTLLDFSRIEAGRVQAAFEPTDLSTLTADLASAFRSATEHAGLELVVDCPPLPEPVYVDREMWEKVLLNLLSNAFKFTFDGRIAVRLAWKGSHVELTVSDTGVGIDVADLPHVFDRFHRVERVRARTHEGSGIGLSLVQELVTMHGGMIQVSSELGKGTTFTVSIPAGMAHLPPERIGAVRTQASTAIGATPYVQEALRWLPVPPDSPHPLDSPHVPHPPDSPVSGTARVLVADDNADMRDYLVRLLGERWTVEAVADGAQALGAARSQPPDLIVADVMMPGLDGFELLQAVRADEQLRGIPVILLSARAGEEARVGGLQAGADDYLVKPFPARELVARVQALLARASVSTQLAEAKREAESANRAKDEFLAMLGHELRNPLAPILTALQLMTLRGVRGADRERTIIERQIRHVVGLVDDLLDVSRITRGKLQLRRERLDLADLIAKALEMTSPAIEERRHRLEVDAPRGLMVEGDQARLAQVFANLLTNAAKYTADGGHIRITLREEQGEAVVAVTDNGTGITAEMLPRVFDLFTQESQAVDRSEGGLGLGLAIVRTMVNAHGGSVVASSAGPGTGATFTVRLPLTTEAPAAVQPAAQRQAPAVGRRVLIVDDNRDAAELLADSLRTLGHAVEVAVDGPSAIQAAAGFDPEVGLLDLGLPVMDGIELAARLHADPRHAGMHLVAVTGYGQEVDRERTRAAGFHQHLVKPVDIRAVDALIREGIETR